MGFLDGLVSELTGDYTGTDASNGSKLGSFLGSVINQAAAQSNQQALSSVVYTEVCGKKSPNEFNGAAGNPDITAYVLSQFDGRQLTALFNVVNRGADAEDQQAMEAAALYIQNNYNVSNQDTFLHIVKRSDNDGWAVWTQFLKKEGLTHYVYYFSLAQ
jgi:hypothetical protein